MMKMIMVVMGVLLILQSVTTIVVNCTTGEFGHYYPIVSVSSDRLMYRDLSITEVSVSIKLRRDLMSGYIMLDRNLIMEKTLNSSNFVNSTQLKYESMKLLAIYELDLERVIMSDLDKNSIEITIEWTNALMDTRPNSMVPLLLNENYEAAILPLNFTQVIDTASSVKFTLDSIDQFVGKKRAIFALGGYSKPVDALFGRTYSVGDFPRSYYFKNQLNDSSLYFGVVMTKPDLVQTFSIKPFSGMESVTSNALNSNYTTLYILKVKQQMFGGKKIFYFKRQAPMRNIYGKLVAIKPDTTKLFYRTVDGTFKGVWSNSVTSVSCPDFGSDICSATSDLPIYDTTEVGIVSEIDFEATKLIVESGNSTDNSTIATTLSNGSAVNYQTVSTTVQPHFRIVLEGFQILSLKDIKVSGRSTSKVVIYQANNTPFPNSTLYDNQFEISTSDNSKSIDLKHRSFSTSTYYLRIFNLDNSQSDNTCYISFTVSVTPFTDDKISPEDNGPIYPYIFIGVFGGIVAVLILVSVIYILWKKTRKPPQRTRSTQNFPSVSSQMSIQSEEIVPNPSSAVGLDLEQGNQTTQYYRMNN